MHGTHQARAARERETYDQGLSERYRSFLMRRMGRYERHRKDRVRAVFERFDAPRTLELGAYEWAKWIEGNGLRVRDLTCINISESELNRGRARAAGARNRPDFRIMDAHALDFADAEFDIVFGSAILHHLDMETALPEIARVLRPGGAICFHEPMDLNPVGRLVRALTPRARTPDERPFRLRDLRLLEAHFDCDFEFTEYLSVPAGALAGLLGLEGESRLMRAAYHADRLISRVPGLRLWSRHVFIEGRAKRG